MSTNRRQKRVASLIKEELSKFLIEEFQDSSSRIITITRVEMKADLKTAHVYIRLYDFENTDKILNILKKRTPYMRKTIASNVKLKYNPMLFFHIDQNPEYEERINKIINELKKDGK